ncbi:mitochondrial protein [Pterulicium gracile]|uniref:Mitochondrial protein n=1 Tax=Pterulicium gracile TaxID=1884261 RepID=A0A5C3QWK1_9AGAR|nr:mitochondrial protein [Pterula gracilis]
MSGLKPPLHNSSTPRDNEPEELEKLRKWQEERVARKLRGDYESAVMHLSELVNDNLETPMRIAAVRVEGAPKTRQSFLGFLIQPILSDPPASSSPEDLRTKENLSYVLHKTRHIGHILKETDLFHSVSARLERSEDNLAAANDVDVVFKAREKGRFYLSTSTELGNEEGSASATGRIRNVFGGAETLEANIALGTKTRRAFRAALTAPLTPDLQTRGEISVYGMQRDNSTFCSSSEDVRGVKASIRNGTSFAEGVHEISYEAVLRSIGNLTPTASISMRKEAGETLKSSFSHTYTFDTRDDKLLGSSGFYTKTLNELAGLGGDAQFYKGEVEGHVARRLSFLPGTAMSLTAKSGLLWSFGGRQAPFPDRFQLGGPTSVRSFRANSMGPRDGADSLGGDAYWSAGLSLISDIPKKPHWPVKTHAYVNAGRLDCLDRSDPVASIQSLLSRPSISAGVGLMYRFDPVRVEVNFGVPLVASKSDGVRKGFQVGIGLEFL